MYHFRILFDRDLVKFKFEFCRDISALITNVFIIGVRDVTFCIMDKLKHPMYITKSNLKVLQDFNY